MNQPAYVGILVNDPLYKTIPSGKHGHERLAFYEEAGSEFGLKPCYVKLSSLVNAGPSVPALVKVNGRYKKKQVPKPLVIHNRAIYASPSSNKALDALVLEGIQLFNKRNRYGKLEVHKLLMEDETMRPHLPETYSANLDTINMMRRIYPSLYLKPVSGSVGKGVMTMRLTEDGSWDLIYSKGKKGIGRIRFTKTLPPFLMKIISSRGYLVQQHLPLAEFKGRPFDLRVSVQRNVTGEWQVTGIAGKVARTGAFVTNVAQGGSVYPLKALLAGYPSLDPAAVEEEIRSFSLRAAECLSAKLPGLADLGFDIGIDELGHPLFIEANGRDQRYSFKECGMTEVWKNTYRNPMAYASFLISQASTKRHNVVISRTINL